MDITRSGEEFGREQEERGKGEIGEQSLGTVGIQRCMQSITVNRESEVDLIAGLTGESQIPLNCTTA